MRVSICLLAFAGALALAQDSTVLTDLPNLSTATEATSAKSKTTATSGSSQTSASDASTTGDSSASSATATGSDASSTTDASSTADASSSGSATSSNSVFHLTGLPTIAGASIPTLVIPYTAAAPFMQKSSYPEGTVFICIGAILGFLGLCVLAWRGIIAYTINRSVKRAALASIMATDAKAPGWLVGGIPMKKGPGGKIYRQPTDGSSLSLEPLSTNGRKIDAYASHRASVAPTRKEQKRDPSGLFFSPTANPGPNMNPGNRGSTYLPAGYYASSAAQPGGAASFARNSPPDSPTMRPATSHLRAPSSGDGSRNRGSFAATNTHRNSAPLLSPSHAPGGGSSGLYSQPSTSSLAVGFGHSGDENLPGSRAPSAYFDDLLNEHGQGPRERF